MKKEKTLLWKCRQHVLEIGPRPLIMGILNVTPDSFSDGGRFFNLQAAVDRGLQMIQEGADIIDVGGESTRPGAAAVSAEEELARVIPVIQALSKAPGAILSIDTIKAGVAQRAVEAGARIINDVSALTNDPDMPRVAKESGAGVILMHMQGTPRTMQKDPHYADVVADVRDYLRARVEVLTTGGVALDAIAVDPGIGFGKTLEHNVRLLANLKALTTMGRPVVVGLSRKSFLGALTGCEVNERLAPSLAGLVFCILNGAHILRVHDVKESRQAMTVAMTLAEAGKALRYSGSRESRS